MILVEDCRLRLDDPIDGFLPELANRRVLRTIESELDDTVPAVRQISVRDLLTFRSGYGELGFLSPTCPLQRAMAAAQLPLSTFYFPGDADAFMRRLGRLPLAAQPGELWLYHMSAEILGVLIARASGSSLAAFFRDRIFGPLGMKDSGFNVPGRDLDRLASCYAQDFLRAEVAELKEASRDIYAEPPAFESGGGDRFVSTADDMLAFGRMLLNKGRHGRERILSRLSVAAMATDQLTDGQKARSPFFPGFWESHGWGLGVAVVTRRDSVSSVPGRFGWDGAFSTSLGIDPREGMVGVFMAQCRPGSFGSHPALQDFWTSAYRAIEA
jgi:CubicO group peptidase (beta-lactamase class C family)